MWRAESEKQHMFDVSYHINILYFRYAYNWFCDSMKL